MNNEEEPRTSQWQRIAPTGILIIILIITASLSTTGTFVGLSVAQMSTLFCSTTNADCQNLYCVTTAAISVQPNCTDEYCETAAMIAFGTPQCAISVDFYSHETSFNNTVRTFSSATFTTYTKVSIANIAPLRHVQRGDDESTPQSA